MSGGFEIFVASWIFILNEHEHSTVYCTLGEYTGNAQMYTSTEKWALKVLEDPLGRAKKIAATLWEILLECL